MWQKKRKFKAAYKFSRQRSKNSLFFNKAWKMRIWGKTIQEDDWLSAVQLNGRKKKIVNNLSNTRTEHCKCLNKAPQ